MRDRPRCGAPQRLKPEREAAFVQQVLQGPGADSGLAAWRGEGLAWCCAEFEAHYSLSGVCAAAPAGAVNLVPRPQHPDSDAAAQAAFKKSTRPAFPQWFKPSILERTLEVWFQDEARFASGAATARVWARRGSRPRAPRQTEYSGSTLFGAVCPASGQSNAWIMPAANAQTLQVQLDELKPKPAPTVTCCSSSTGPDGTKSQALRIPDNLTRCTCRPMPGTQPGRTGGTKCASATSATGSMPTCRTRPGAEGCLEAPGAMTGVLRQLTNFD